jgi:hypothetical protein
MLKYFIYVCLEPTEFLLVILGSGGWRNSWNVLVKLVKLKGPTFYDHMLIQINNFFLSEAYALGHWGVL